VILRKPKFDPPLGAKHRVTLATALELAMLGSEWQGWEKSESLARRTVAVYRVEAIAGAGGVDDPSTPVSLPQSWLVDARMGFAVVFCRTKSVKG